METLWTSIRDLDMVIKYQISNLRSFIENVITESNSRSKDHELILFKREKILYQKFIENFTNELCSITQECAKNQESILSTPLIIIVSIVGTVIINNVIVIIVIYVIVNRSKIQMYKNPLDEPGSESEKRLDRSRSNMQSINDSDDGYETVQVKAPRS